jgi:hypothetical protein
LMAGKGIAGQEETPRNARRIARTVPLQVHVN